MLADDEAERVLVQPRLTTRLGLRDRALLETLYATGLRHLELIRLRLGDLDWARAVLVVREGKGRRDRVLPLGRRPAHWLARYLAQARPALVRGGDAGLVFLTTRGHAFRPSRLSERVRAYVDAARLGKRGSCHLFRQTMATLLLEGGADVRYVQELLGHAQLSTTAVYTHVTLGRLATVYAQAHPGERAFRAAAGGETGQIELWARGRGIGEG